MSRRSVMILTMAGLIAGAMHGLADEPTARVSAQPGAISGLVVDLEGRPVAGADVWAVARQERFGPTRSGPDGRFRLAELKPDKPVTVWADAPAWRVRDTTTSTSSPARTATSAGSRS